MKTRGISRRRFLGRTAAAAGAGLTILTRSNWASAATRKVSANERIVTGHIGIGGMGRSHFDRLLNYSEAHIAAVADPDAKMRDAAKAKAAEFKVSIDTYNDFHEMLERKDIDAIFVATPDHWHALAAIAAMQAGKDVYCEKPLTLTIAEGRKMVETARRYDRVVQMGTQQRSDQKQFLHACELVRNGRIGEVKRAVCFFGPNPRVDYTPNEDPPPGLDWNLYLGPAPWRPFNKQIHPYNFRYWRDYSGGLLTDWGVHLFDIAQWGLGKDDTSARRIEAEGEMYEDNMYEFPRRLRIRYDYGDAVIEWQQGDEESKSFEEGEGYGTKFYGTDGEVFVNRSYCKVHPKPGKTINEQFGANDTRLYDAPGHHQDFFNCMRERRKPICDVETGHRATCISHLGNIVFRLGHPVEYDPVKETFPGDLAASRMVEKPMRAPWHL
ncbi:MAG: Gfo/Idh/MocA family oxidoreductase [Candidatus Hydrogenedentes bacterium]|nr:Gfo/Idh/MocA family oxidoreductase [Candidatus Hydrogenedentota bacterium]